MCAEYVASEIHLDATISNEHTLPSDTKSITKERST